LAPGRILLALGQLSRADAPGRGAVRPGNRALPADVAPVDLDEYPQWLRKTLIESRPPFAGNRKTAEAEIDSVIAILGERKKARKERC
jgi:hypothetical protein